MKANKALKISLAALIAACAIPYGAVFAAENGTTEYPVKTTVDGKEVLPFECELTFSDEKPITDYAVYGDNIAFASNTSMFVLYTDKNGDRKLDKEHHYQKQNRIERLDYDKNGNLYLDVKTDGIFIYPNYIEQATHEFPEYGNTVKLSTDEEYRLSNDGLHYFSGVEHEVLGTDFKNLKVFDDKAYAVKDNVLYTFTGNKADRVDVDYTDFETADHILCGDVAGKLTAAGYEIKTAEIKPGSYYTQINADVIGDEAGDTFIQIRTEKTNGDKPCIVLCESGNATIVATNEGMYITATENLSDPVPSTQKNDWAIGSDGKRLAAYTVRDIGVYASPFMSESTKIATLESGAENHVEVIEKFEFNSVKFYRVRYTVKGEGGNDTTISGFVAAKTLTEYDYKAEDNEPHENGDKEFKYETNVVSVVLAIVIVALVIVAIMYISLIGSKKNKDKNEKKNKKKKREPEPVDYNEDEDEE